MKKYFIFIVFTITSFIGYCDFTSYFEIKLKGETVFHSLNAAHTKINLDRSVLDETDLMEITYTECGMTTKNDYELQVHTANKENELLFVSDEPKFVLHMSWFLQFGSHPMTISLVHKKYSGSAVKQFVFKITELHIT